MPRYPSRSARRCCRSDVVMDPGQEGLLRQDRLGGRTTPAGVLRARRAILLAAMTATLAASANRSAQAQSLDARYVISMTGIRVGQSAWSVNIDADRYSVSANGGSVDLLNVLLRGEGVARVSGSVKDGRLVPAIFSSSLVEDGVKGDLKMTLDEGVVTAVEDNGPPPSA